MLDYPSVLPLDCSKTLFEIARNKELGERKEEFAHCFWNIQGYVQGLLLGPGPAHEAGLFGSGSKTLESRQAAAVKDGQLREIGENLMQLHAELMNNPPQFGASPTAKAFNWALIVQMIPVVIQMLKELGIIKTEIAMPGFVGVAPGDFPESGSQTRKTTVKGQTSEENSVGHDGKLTLNCSVDELDLNANAEEAFAKAKIKTVGDAIEYQKSHEKGLQSLPGIGEATEAKFDELVKDLK